MTKGYCQLQQVAVKKLFLFFFNLLEKNFFFPFSPSPPTSKSQRITQHGQSSTFPRVSDAEVGIAGDTFKLQLKY